MRLSRTEIVNGGPSGGIALQTGPDHELQFHPRRPSDSNQEPTKPDAHTELNTALLAGDG